MIGFISWVFSKTNYNTCRKLEYARVNCIISLNDENECLTKDEANTKFCTASSRLQALLCNREGRGEKIIAACMYVHCIKYY